MFLALLPLSVVSEVPASVFPTNPHPGVADTACPDGWFAATVSCYGEYHSDMSTQATTCDPISAGQETVWRKNIDVPESDISVSLDGGYGSKVAALNAKVFTEIFGEFGWGDDYLRHNPCGDVVELIPRRAVMNDQAFSEAGTYFEDGPKIKAEFSESNPIEVRIVDKMMENTVQSHEDVLRALDVNAKVYQSILEPGNWDAVNMEDHMSVCNGAGSFPICFRRKPNESVVERQCTEWVKEQAEDICGSDSNCKEGVLSFGFWRNSMWGLCVETNGFSDPLSCDGSTMSNVVQYAAFVECRTQDQAHFVAGTNGHSGYWACHAAVMAQYGSCTNTLNVASILSSDFQGGDDSSSSSEEETLEPTPKPTHAPTDAPTFAPTDAPTSKPTAPTDAPTFAPTDAPTFAPTEGSDSEESDEGCEGDDLTCTLEGIEDAWTIDLCIACDLETYNCHTGDITWNGQPQTWYSCVDQCELYVDPNGWVQQWASPPQLQAFVDNWHNHCDVPAARRLEETKLLKSFSLSQH